MSPSALHKKSTQRQHTALDHIDSNSTGLVQNMTTANCWNDYCACRGEHHIRGGISRQAQNKNTKAMMNTPKRNAAGGLAGRREHRQGRGIGHYSFVRGSGIAGSHWEFCRQLGFLVFVAAYTRSLPAFLCFCTVCPPADHEIAVQRPRPLSSRRSAVQTPNGPPY